MVYLYGVIRKQERRLKHLKLFSVSNVEKKEAKSRGNVHLFSFRFCAKMHDAHAKRLLQKTGRAMPKMHAPREAGN